MKTVSKEKQAENPNESLLQWIREQDQKYPNFDRR